MEKEMNDMIYFDATEFQLGRGKQVNEPMALLSKTGSIKLNAATVQMMELDPNVPQSVVIGLNLTTLTIWLYTNKPDVTGFAFRPAAKKEAGALVCQARAMVQRLSEALDLALKPGQKKSIRYRVEKVYPGAFKLI